MTGMTTSFVEAGSAYLGCVPSRCEACNEDETQAAPPKASPSALSLASAVSAMRWDEQKAEGAVHLDSLVNPNATGRYMIGKPDWGTADRRFNAGARQSRFSATVPVGSVPADVLVDADESTLGLEPPTRLECRLIEMAVQRIFTLDGQHLQELVSRFRQWELPANTSIVRQGAAISSGPGLTVLSDGVVDVFRTNAEGDEQERLCTYDRSGQCFGELQLLYNSSVNTNRRIHWATIATRTAATVWVISRSNFKEVLKHSRQPETFTSV
mmetsp:Transcript_43291/g.99781  ORF Transcript_43291/g.99781 Transcript_43291/m.99781 type:complete len:269 (+) Transcript_43291:44-850(+)